MGYQVSLSCRCRVSGRGYRVATIVWLFALAWSSSATADPGPDPGAGVRLETVDEVTRLLTATDGVQFSLPARVDAAAVARAYAAADSQPIWLRHAGAPARALLARLQAAERHGLRPDSYPAAALARALRHMDAAGTRARARLELRLTAAFLRYAGDLRHGRSS